MMEMLTYMYTGKAPNLEKMADSLLPAADKVSNTDREVHIPPIFSSFIQLILYSYTFFAYMFFASMPHCNCMCTCISSLV